MFKKISLALSVMFLVCVSFTVNAQYWSGAHTHNNLGATVTDIAFVKSGLGVAISGGNLWVFDSTENALIFGVQNVIEIESVGDGRVFALTETGSTTSTIVELVFTGGVLDPIQMSTLSVFTHQVISSNHVRFVAEKTQSGNMFLGAAFEDEAYVYIVDGNTTPSQINVSGGVISSNIAAMSAISDTSFIVWNEDAQATHVRFDPVTNQIVTIQSFNTGVANLRDVVEVKSVEPNGFSGFALVSDTHAYFVSYTIATGFAIEGTVYQFPNSSIISGRTFAAAKDIDGDGDIDFVVARPGKQALVYTNLDAQLNPPVQFTYRYAGISCGGPIDIGDWNGWGMLEIFGTSCANGPYGVTVQYFVDFTATQELDASNFEVAAYPNPFTNYINVSPGNFYGEYDLIVVGPGGRVVESFTSFRGEAKINANGWPAGVYFIQVAPVGDSEAVVIRKVVKARS
jgi:hypothetical protein